MGDRSSGAGGSGATSSAEAQAYGDAFSDVYDEWYGDITDATATARFVAERCGDGPVLELGVGTGRIARRLIAEGLAVIGLDGSAAMLAGCVERSGRMALPVVQADMGCPPFAGKFGAVLVAFNTLFNLADVGRQAALFSAVAPLLADDGLVVIEAITMNDLASGPSRSVAPSRYRAYGLTVVGTTLDREAQTIIGQHLDITDGGLRSRPWTIRWSRPDEIDEMAASAGLVLVDRLADWEGMPYEAGADAHISLYGLDR